MVVNMAIYQIPHTCFTSSRRFSQAILALNCLVDVFLMLYLLQGFFECKDGVPFLKFDVCML